MKAVTHPWLGEWHRPSSAPDADGQPTEDVIQAVITRASSAPDLTGNSLFELNGGIWVFRNLVWLFDPLGIPPDLYQSRDQDDALMAYALQRQHPLLEGLGLNGLVHTGRPPPQPPISTEWLHVAMHISAQATGDGDALSVDAWTTSQGLDLFLQRARLRRRQRDDSWPADLPITLRWRLRCPGLPVIQLQRLEPGALLQLGLPVTRASFDSLIGAGHQISLVPCGNGDLWQITALDTHSRQESPTPLFSGDAMHPTDPTDEGDFTEKATTFEAYGDDPNAETVTTTEAEAYAEDDNPDAEPATEESEAEADIEATPTLRGLGDMPVPVSLLCGRVEVSLAELRTWGPGSELALSTADLDEIELFCGQRLLARGRLLRLNEQLAVSITQVLL